VGLVMGGMLQFVVAVLVVPVLTVQPCCSTLCHQPLCTRRNQSAYLVGQYMPGLVSLVPNLAWIEEEFSPHVVVCVCGR
jgi:hypothetical protein